MIQNLDLKGEEQIGEEGFYLMARRQGNRALKYSKLKK